MNGPTDPRYARRAAAVAASGLALTLALIAGPGHAQETAPAPAPDTALSDQSAGSAAAPPARPGTAFAPALSLVLPETAVMAGQRQDGPTSYRMPVGPFRDGYLPSRTSEGMLDQSAWRIATPGLTTLQVLMPLRDQILRAGYRIVYECEAADCGGFDFRYNTEVLPEPDMHVDLGDFRYLGAERSGAMGREILSLLVSRSADQSFVQVTQMMPTPEAGANVSAPAAVLPVAPLVIPPATGAPVAPLSGDPGAVLESAGAVALDDLVFASGAATLQAGEYASLEALAKWLQADPARRIALVGHTDASGGLEANMALSLRRAASVRDTMVGTLGAPAAQIVAQGVGPLSPRTGNLTPEGRERNRRVEAVLLSPP